MATKRCLLLSCSQAKRKDAGLLPAIERYDGPLFRVLRCYLRQRLTDRSDSEIAPDVYVLSAEFGLIPADCPIPNYDRRMTSQRAKELHLDVVVGLRRVLTDNGPYQELFICMGRNYRQVLEGWETCSLSTLTVKIATGTLGMKQAELHDWLYGNPPPASSHTQRGVARIRGIEVRLTPRQVLDVARGALAEGRGDPADYRAWYVQVDTHQVAPKWLVSQLTGLPVSAFVTDEARRVLTQLDIGVVRA